MSRSESQSQPELRKFVGECSCGQGLEIDVLKPLIGSTANIRWRCAAETCDGIVHCSLSTIERERTGQKAVIFGNRVRHVDLCDFNASGGESA